MVAKFGEAEREYAVVVGSSPAKHTMSPKLMLAELQLAPMRVTISVSAQEAEGAERDERIE